MGKTDPKAFRRFRRACCVLSFHAVYSIPAVGSAEQPQRYFPPEGPTVSCGGDSKPIPAVSDLENNWFSSHLRAANEPSLFATTSSIKAAGETVLRFTWLRTFHHPVIVRVTWSRGGQPVLTTVELTGAGGYEPGTVKRRTQRVLNPGEIEILSAAIDAARLASAAPRECNFGFDGSEWIFETVNRSGYRVVIRWTPTSGEVRKLGLTLLRLSRWRFGDARDIY